MSTPKDGGPAFPVAFVQGADIHGADAKPGNEGMTIRDWFAGQALSGFLAGRRDDINNYNPALVAKDCYLYADAMLAEREKGQQ